MVAALTRLLSEAEFHACFAHPMIDVTQSAKAELDIWPYVDALDLDTLKLPYLNDVHYVIRDNDEQFDLIHIGTGHYNALLVIVIDREKSMIRGHHILNLNEIYGAQLDHLRPID